MGGVTTRSRRSRDPLRDPPLLPRSSPPPASAGELQGGFNRTNGSGRAGGSPTFVLKHVLLPKSGGLQIARNLYAMQARTAVPCVRCSAHCGSRCRPPCVEDATSCRAQHTMAHALAPHCADDAASARRQDAGAGNPDLAKYDVLNSPFIELGSPFTAW